MAVVDAKGGKDVGSYTKAVEALARVAPQDPEAKLDTAWVGHTSRVVKAETDRLEHELKGYKNNLIKESIRVREPCGLLLSQSTHPETLLILCLSRWAMRTWATTIISSGTCHPPPKPTLE